MIPATEQKITRLRALLERIQLRAAEPRPAKFVAPIEVEVEEQREPTLPGHAAAAAVVEAPIEPAIVVEEPIVEAPVVEERAEEPIVEAAPAEEVREAATLEEAPIEPAIVIGEPEFEAPEPIPVIAEGIPIEAAPAEPTPAPGAISEPIVTEAEEPAERAEAVSGEFAVAEVPMELEELGPADELHEDETVVEIHVDEPSVTPAPAVEELPIAVAREAEPGEERISEPPASGRELVATPYESQRLAVAAPATPDQHGLELTEEPEPPPESSRNLRAAPAIPATSDVIELQPGIPASIEPIHVEPEPVHVEPEPVHVEPEPVHVEPEPVHVEPEPVHVEPEPVHVEEPVVEPQPVALESEPAPALSIEPERVHVEEPPVVAAPIEPQQVAVAVALGHARPVEHVVVGVDADVIHAELTPADVAAFIGAARAPRPETFGVLLDAALDL